MKNNTEEKVWFITGAGRGMGVNITKAALAAGRKVVATGRSTNSVAQALGKSENLLIVKLDVTNSADAAAAVNVGVEKFGRIDVLVNNAANFVAGFFKELTQEEIVYKSLILFIYRSGLFIDRPSKNEIITF